MNIKSIQSFCEQFPAVTSDYPFGPESLCYRVGNKIFVHVFPVGVPGALRILLEDDTISRDQLSPMLLLRCEPFYGDFMRRQYPGAVLRPYHSPPQQQAYGNTVLLNKTVPDAVIKEMIHHSFSYVLQKLPQKLQKEILAQKPLPL